MTRTEFIVTPDDVHDTADIATADLIAWLREQVHDCERAVGLCGGEYGEDDLVERLLVEAAMLQEVADRLEGGGTGDIDGDIPFYPTVAGGF